MLKLSRAMVGHVEATSIICQILFGHVFGFVSQRQLFGPRSGPRWPSWAPLRYLEATAMLLGAKLGDLEGKLGHRGDHVEARSTSCLKSAARAKYIYIYIYGSPFDFIWRGWALSFCSGKVL